MDKYKIKTKENNYYGLLNGVYAHGKFEELLGSDILYAKKSNRLFNKCKDLIYNKNEKQKNKIVLNYKDEDYKCILYIWQCDKIKTLCGGIIKEIYRPRGLVVLEDDIEAIKYAEKKYKLQDSYL